ncbi:MAG TPA: hypothetical protein IAC41_02330, partial [Candidatus Merdenecus merdavium]|nr:hypothetical protein [Candidatus Merdenecus merdavium]
MFKRKKWRVFTSCIMAILMLFSVLPVNITYADDGGADRTSVVKDVTAMISQNETAIIEGGTVSATETVSADISFVVPLGGEESSQEVSIKKGDKAAFHVAKGFDLTNKSAKLTTADGLVMGHVELAKDKTTGEITANVIFDGKESIFNETQGKVTAKFHLDLTYEDDEDSRSPGEHSVSILGKGYKVIIPSLETNTSIQESNTKDIVAKEGEASEGKDVSHLLTGQNVTVKQDEKEIQEGDVVLDDRPLTIGISFGVPVLGDGHDESSDLYVKKGDFAYFPLSNSFQLPESSTPIELKTATGDLLGHVTFEEIDGVVTAIVDFDGDDDIFNGVMSEVSALFNATFDLKEDGGESGSGAEVIVILDKEYKFEKPPVELTYDLKKSGEVKLDEKTVEWTVTVSGKKGTQDVDLGVGGYELRDDLTNVGTYVPGSFTVNDKKVEDPTVEEGKLSYTFPENSTGEQTIKFKTEIPEDKYYGSGNQTIDNKAELYEEDQYITEGSGGVTFTPEWIKKEGKKEDGDGNSGVYNPKDRTITWTITANQMEATLKNPVITDLLPDGLTLEQATVQYWDGEKWGDETAITPNDEGQYEIGNINKGEDRIPDTKVLLTIVSKVPDDEYVAGVTTYKNKASISWEEQDGNGIGSNEVSIGIGYNAIGKKGEISDRENQKIKWTVDVNARDQEIPDLKVYDLLIYGKQGSVQLNDLEIDGVDDEVKSSLVAQYNQRYDEGSFDGRESLKIEVIPVMKDGERVGDLLEVTGFSKEKTSFTFESIVTNPDIFAGNKTTNVSNTALLFSGNKKLNHANANVPYPSQILKKEMLNVGHTEDPAAGVNDILTNGDHGFDYEDKSAIFRISVNSYGLDLTKANGHPLGEITVTDQLPDGWELAEILPGKDYLIFEADKNENNESSVKAKGDALDNVDGLTYTKEKDSITFTFDELNKPYVILIKARPNAETLDRYFSKNGYFTETNKVTMKAENWDGIESNRNVAVKSELLSKTARWVDDGVVGWTVDYKPYELKNEFTKLEDTLPSGMDLRTDANGKLVLDDNITITELILNQDGSYSEGESVTPVLGTNVSYDNETRVLSFTMPDSAKAYRFTYLTDITGEPGTTVTNQVKLYGGDEVQEDGSQSYYITDRDGSATMRRSGWIEITKVDGATKAPLAGVEFTIYALDGTTVIRKGKTGYDGKLKLRGLPEGKYILRETSVPEGYNVDDTDHSLFVERKDSETITCSIDGKTGEDANLITVKNYQDGTVGGLTISKTVLGERGDKTKSFEFTITLEGANGQAVNDTYAYTGTDNSSGEIQIKDGKGTISLADGQSITISNIPKDTKYTIQEINYSEEGYVSESTGNTGSIVAEETQVTQFTNTHVPAFIELEALKVLEGKNLTEDTFSFDLKDEEGNILQTKTNDVSGNVVFDKIQYDTVGEYRYTIQEVSGTEPGVTYDSNIIGVTVKVAVNEDGLLVATPLYEGDQVFTNTYKPAEGEIVLEAQKVLEGQELDADGFSFELRDQDGKVLQTKKNDAQGKIYFDPITYTEVGTYQYTIQEVEGNQAGITYDTHVINVTVTV